jgi:glycyl-tRNA synthetase
MSAPDMETLTSLAKRKGFVYPSSDIYGGFSSTWDYGPLGTELLRNIKDAWWRKTVLVRNDVVGLNASILMHPRVWEVSGHVDNFQDPLVECPTCRRRYRQDDVSDMRCPHDEAVLTDPRMFNTMFKTYVGPVEDDAAVAYLRPETAQSTYVNFKNVLDSSRVRIPFGIAQIGKSFRNEITTGNFIFRSREFEQMELQYFVAPGVDDESHALWVETRFAWWQDLGIDTKRLRLRTHNPDELAHYAKATTDIEYEFPFGWGEIEGVSNRSDFDLRRHAEASGTDLAYFDEAAKKHIVPFVIEPAAGVDRAALAFLASAYTQESLEGKVRVVLKLHPSLAPFKISVFPLARNKAPLVELATRIADDLRSRWPVFYDETGSIGRRYARQDEAGTPFAVTVDYESLDNRSVTVRDRDTMEQQRIAIDELEQHFATLLVT